jgi:hypothetical protein
MPGASKAAQKDVGAGDPHSKEIAWLEETC